MVTMASLVYEAMVDDGIPMIFGFPNEYFYRHEKRLLGTGDIGELDYYVLPINIGTVLRKARQWDFLSRVYANLRIHLAGTLKNQVCTYNIEKVVDAQFEEHRYDDSYCQADLDGHGICKYRIYEEGDAIRTLYIIDVIPLTPRVFAQAVKRVYEITRHAADIIIYVGMLPFNPRVLFKVPRSMRPQRVRMTGKVLIPQVVDVSVLDMKNWNVNISNFDVR